MGNAKTEKRKRQTRNRIARNMDCQLGPGWVQKSEWHFQRVLMGEILDYWPSKRKWMFQRRVMVGDVHSFINGWEALAGLPGRINRGA